MTRIFAVLAAVSIVVMGATLVIGLSLEGAAGRVDTTSQSRMTTHFLMGTLSALGVVLVQSIGMTYFVGTSRWCKEVVETYGLDHGLIESSQRLKRKTFPWSITAMLVIVAVIALGAASDPATGRANTEAWGGVHLLAAFCGAAFIVMTYAVVWNRIRANQAIIDSIVAQVREIRFAKGLEID